jgi:hypothetical protein
MIKKMEQDQEEFEESLESLISTVASFYTYNDEKKYLEYAVTCRNVMAKI